MGSGENRPFASCTHPAPRVILAAIPGRRSWGRAVPGRPALNLSATHPSSLESAPIERGLRLMSTENPASMPPKPAFKDEPSGKTPFPLILSILFLATVGVSVYAERAGKP